MQVQKKFTRWGLGICVAAMLIACDGRKPTTEPLPGYLNTQGGNQTVAVGSRVRLQANSDGNTDTTTEYYWLFSALPVRSTAVLSDPSVANPEFVADQPGTYIMSVSARKENHERVSRSVSVTAVDPTNVTATKFDHGTTTAACVTCHDGVVAGGKSANHLATSNVCEACHAVALWAPVVYLDHTQVVGTCMGCHNDVIAAGKPPAHPPATEDCAQCHRTASWAIPAPVVPPQPTFDHAAVVQVKCSSCHNNDDANGLPADHIAVTEECNRCHTTGAWKPALTDHATSSVVLACVACHDGKYVVGKTANHLATTDACRACHSTNGFSPIFYFNHAEAIGACVSCHNASVAMGKPVSHVVSTENCASCHVTSAWLPARMDHTQTIGACYSCHRQPVGHPRTTADCGTCHRTVTWVL